MYGECLPIRHSRGHYPINEGDTVYGLKHESLNYNGDVGIAEVLKETSVMVRITMGNRVGELVEYSRYNLVPSWADIHPNS